MNKQIEKTVDFSAMSRDEMEKLIIDLMDRNTALELECKNYLDQLKRQRSRMYGRSTEKSDELQLSIDDLQFFNESEAVCDPEETEPELYDCIEHSKPKKKKGAKKQATKKLPVKHIEYKLSDEEAVCSKCGSPLSYMKKIVRKEFTVIPAQVYVTEHIQYVYVCRNCSNNGTEANIVKAQGPEPVLRNSLASPSMLAWIISRKFAESLPLYRQEQQHLRNGLKLSRQTMANWQLRATELYLEPLYRLMHKKLLEQGVIHADETVLEVLQEPGRNASDISRMWIYCSSASSEIPMVLYEYSSSRAHTVPEKFLAGFSGYLLTDAYEAYRTLSRKHPEIINVFCWAHLRREFTDIVKAMGKEIHTENTESSKAIRMIDSLFHIGREIQDESPENKVKIRNEKALPKVDAFFEWAKEMQPRTIKNSSFAKAIAYALDKETELRRYLEDGRLEASNNRAERMAKKFVIGRKNWIFNNTPRGAESSAIAYSIVMTALLNALDPFRYLKYLFESLAGRSLLPDSELEQYLPWSKELPESLYSKAVTLEIPEAEVSATDI